MERKTWEKGIIGVIVFAVLVVIITGVSYAFWTFNKTQSTSNTVKTNCLRLELEDVTDSKINLQETYPITDSDAEKLKPYTFRIKNMCSNGIKYDIKLDVFDNVKLIAPKYVALKFNGGAKTLLNAISTTNTTSTYDDLIVSKTYKLGSDKLPANGSKEYSLNMWIDEAASDTDSMNKILESKINLEAVIDNGD